LFADENNKLYGYGYIAKDNNRNLQILPWIGQVCWTWWLADLHTALTWLPWQLIKESTSSIPLGQSWPFTCLRRALIRTDRLIQTLSTTEILSVQTSDTQMDFRRTRNWPLAYEMTEACNYWSAL